MTPQTDVTYTVTGTVKNCSSSAIHNITVYNIYSKTENVNICNGEIYRLPDGNIAAFGTGTYISALKTFHGCDSLITTKLIVENLQNNDKDTTICRGNLLTLDAGNQGSVYAWNTGETTQTITVSETGKYIVTVSKRKL